MMNYDAFGKLPDDMKLLLEELSDILQSIPPDLVFYIINQLVMDNDYEKYGPEKISPKILNNLYLFYMDNYKLHPTNDRMFNDILITKKNYTMEPLSQLQKSCNI